MAATAGRWRVLHLIYVVLRTIAISAVGGAVFWSIGFPAPWISGGMVAVAAATLSGVQVAVPAPLREVVFFVLGVSIGSALSPESIAGIAVWPLSVALLVLSVPMITWGAGILLIYRGWPRNDALLATAPGALGTVLLVADAVGANVARIALVQTMRLAMLVVLLPLLVKMFSDITPVAVGGAAGTFDPVQMFMLVAAAIAGSIGARLLRLPAGTLVGSMVGAGALYASGIVTAPIPTNILTPGLIVVGAFIGTRFVGMSMHSIRAGLIDGLYAFAAAFAIAVGLAAVVTLTLGISIGETVLAFAPGGFEVMIVIAFSLGLDAAYVGLHQVVRFFVIAVGAPIVFRNYRRNDG
jgi:uncharacterized protein